MNIDLNIDNYTKEELLELLEIPNDYNNSIIEFKTNKLKKAIENNKSVDANLKEKTLEFLENAKENLKKRSKDLDDVYHLSYNLGPTKLEDEFSNHEIQKRPKLPYVSSSVSEFYQGKINPIKKRFFKKTLVLDSRFRSNYYTSQATNYTITLPTQFNNVVQMQLGAIELPTTYYVISKQYNNNYLEITIIKNDDTEYTATIKINDGNYNETTILAALNDALTNLGSPFNDLAFNVDITSGSGSGQTILGFKANIANYKNLKLNFLTLPNGTENDVTPLPLKLGWILGFRNGLYINNLNYVSEGIIDVTGPRYVYLVVDDYNNNVINSFFSAFNSSLLNKNILARISLQSQPFSILEQNNLLSITIPREYLGPINIQNLTIQLLDEYGRILDINAMDYSFSLILTTAYDF